MMILKPVFARFIRQGTLHVIDVSGKKYTFTGEPGPEVTIRFHNRSVEWGILINPDMGFGEGYTKGVVTIEKGSLYDLLDLGTRNLAIAPFHMARGVFEILSYPLRFIFQHNSLKQSKENVAHHYDLNGQLYKLFLDKDMQYSCAYFEKKTDDLEKAQENKKKHIAAKLRLKKGQKVLDIGSGWGGLALYLAQSADVEVTGLTLSEEQLEVARTRAKKEGLDHKVQFHLRDYRAEKGQYDRIVSVGMFEHVGTPNYLTFFDHVRVLLAPDGVALLHAIGRSTPPEHSKSWISKYIFPGGYCPALSEVLNPIEKSRLFVTDIEILRHHYAETLRHWYERFQANRKEVRALYDEQFCRMWDYYLNSSEVGFRNLGLMIFQIQLMKDVSSSPLTRDYMIKNG